MAEIDTMMPTTDLLFADYFMNSKTGMQDTLIDE